MLYGLLGNARVYLTLQKALGADRLRRLCVEVLDPKPAERILDIGCGPAYILEFMPATVYYGFDLERRYIAYARQRYGGQGRFYCERFTEAHVDALGPFDAAILIGLLHHLSDGDSLDLLRLIGRALKPSGRIVTLDPSFAEGQSKIAKFVAAHDRGAFVRKTADYLRLADTFFLNVQHRLVHGVGRLPSTEIIMRLSLPRI